MKLSLSIPSTTAIVLFLTLLINVVGLQMSLERHFPLYIESIDKQFQEQNKISPEWLQALLSVNSLDHETQTDYANALHELSNIASSLQSLSNNPELYVVTGTGGASSDAFHLYNYSNLVEQARNENLLKIFSHPFTVDPHSAEWQFMYAIMKNFLLLNAIWIVFIVALYTLWVRRLFRPIHFIIESLRNFSSHSGQILDYTKNDEFLPLITSLNNFRSSLDQQEKIRSNFLSDISHEIRTPITAISFMLEAIRDGVMDFDTKNIAILQNEMTRLVHITETIMNHEKFLHTLDENIEKISCKVYEIAEMIGEQYKPKWQKNLQKFVINLPKNTKIWASREQLEQVFHNIFSNFSKYAGKNSMLTLSYKNDKSSDILIFSDDGIGMKTEELPLAKEKFFRSDTGRKNDSEELSMGIWLSIIERIMLLHNGSLEISHNTPKGFTLTLYFSKHV